MILKLTGILGPSKAQGDMAEIRCLNRIIRYVEPGNRNADAAYIDYEPDARHVQILMKQLGITSTSKNLGQPGSKRERDAAEEPLSAEETTLYKSCAMRLIYLAMDRVDIQFTAKELARRVQSPTKEDMQHMKKCVRYLKGKPRLIQRYAMQEMPEQLTGFSDADFAGCTTSRKSTSSSIVFFGQHLLRSSSTTQNVIALSSGESEFYAAVKSTSVLLGMKAMMSDLGVDLRTPIKLHVDSTACLGAAGRRGAGRIRHIATSTLWVQNAVGEGRIVLAKVAGTENPADLGTKVLSGTVLTRLLKRCGLVHLEGQSELTLHAEV